MKKLILTLLATALLAVSGCHSNHFYDELPQPIARFLSLYWADPDIENFTQPSPEKYVVIIKNGPSLIFDGKYAWSEIDGNGLPLPQILLFDQLPEKLYHYLESGSQLGQVFEITRNARTYHVRLLDSSLIFDLQTRTVRTEQS